MVKRQGNRGYIGLLAVASAICANRNHHQSRRTASMSMLIDAQPSCISPRRRLVVKYDAVAAYVFNACASGVRRHAGKKALGAREGDGGRRG